PAILKTVIYRISQEALNNVAKHSKATQVALSLQRANGMLKLTIQDNGQGFNMEDVLSRDSSRNGVGLSSMRERVELSGGFFSIESGIGKGTAIKTSWPLA
ncbi:MAG TPA: ATP-binding protein, partial [Thermodesulfobacteriota bacterium]|nr:ATP-binding protein [Thermodesulfobacteriota bacterium]